MLLKVLKEYIETESYPFIQKFPSVLKTEHLMLIVIELRFVCNVVLVEMIAPDGDL